MKRKRIIISLVAIIAMLGLFSGCSRHRWHGGDHSARILEHMDEHVEDLNLTEDQQKKYQEIRSNVEAQIAKQMVQHKEFKVVMVNKINEDNPDISEINTLLKEEMNDMPEKISVYLDYFEEFYNILNQEQKDQILEDVRSKMKRWNR